MSLDWYVVRVKSNRERITSIGLAARCYEVFLPEYVPFGVQRKRPLFPGYLFCRFDAVNRLPVLTQPGVIHIVGIGNRPAPVDARELESLRVLLKTGLPINADEAYTVGETVRIEKGPLAGITGVVSGLESQRLLVSITLLHRSVSVAFPRQSISRGARSASTVTTANKYWNQPYRGEIRASERETL